MATTDELKAEIRDQREAWLEAEVVRLQHALTLAEAKADKLRDVLTGSNKNRARVAKTLADTRAELDWLTFFYQQADFGPAHGDVLYWIKQDYKRTGKPIPEGYDDSDTED